MVRPKIGDIYYWVDPNISNGKCFEIAISREEYEEHHKNLNLKPVIHKENFLYGKIIFDEDNSFKKGEVGFLNLKDHTTQIVILDKATLKTINILYENN